MSITEGSIEPRPVANPHAEGKQELPIAPISCWTMGAISSVLAFPTGLDEERLKQAFAIAASYWPTVCGRLVKSSAPNSTEFSISLTQSPIPYSTQTTEDEYPYKDSYVIQESLGSYCPDLRNDYFVPGADAPQLAVRLSTLANGKSVLGVRWGHILGDAAAFSRFLEDVSLFYNMPRMDLGEDMPTFEPHVTIPRASEQTLKEYHLDILTPLPIPEVVKGYTDSTSQSQRFTVTLSPKEIAHITAARTQGEHTSDGDMIAAWWINVLERAGKPISRAVQTMNYRSWHKGDRAFPPNLPTLAANVAQQREIHLPEPVRDQDPPIRVRNIARTIRAGMNELKEDRTVMLKWLGNAAHEIATAAHEGKGMCLIPKPGGVVLNSNMRYDWAVKFGQTGSCYHTDISLLNFLRVFLANRPEGSEQVPMKQRDVELVFRVEWGPGLEAVQKIIDSDKAKWAATEPATPVEKAPEPEVRTLRMNSMPAKAPWGGL